MSDSNTHEESAWAEKLEAMRRGVGLRLDAHGAWWQGDTPFEHAGLIAALNRGMTLHPETREPVVYIGDKWCYFESEDLPFIVHGLVFDGAELWADLNTGLRAHIPANGFIQDDVRVLVRLEDGRTARLSRSAQSGLADALHEDGGRLFLRYGERVYRIGESPTSD